MISDPIWLKALGPGREPINGGTGTWPPPGEWTTPIPNLVPCEQGWHVCTPSQMLDWLPSTDNDIWLVEIKGSTIDAGNKTVAESARLVRRLQWNDRTARLFAVACAEQVLHLFEAAHPGDLRARQAIETARAYALGDATKADLTAAWTAATDATDAASATANARAAWAAWAAANAASAAANSASAASSAAWAATDATDAARAAARAAQTEQLLTSLTDHHG